MGYSAIEGSAPLSAAIVWQSTPAAAAELIVGSNDGFISAFSTLEGQPLKRFLLDSPVVGIVGAGPAGWLTVATQNRIYLLDAQWQVVGRFSGSFRWLKSLDSKSVLVGRNDFSVIRLTLEVD